MLAVELLTGLAFGLAFGVMPGHDGSPTLAAIGRPRCWLRSINFWEDLTKG